jgi:penicillin amidase
MVMPRRWTIANELYVFVLIWLGQLISLTGSGLTGFALGVWYYQKQGSVTQLALFSFFNVVPGVLLSPVAGALVDRWDRRRAMLLSDMGGGLCSLTVWLLLAGGQFHLWPLQIWHLYVPVAISSAFSAFRWPAYYAVTTVLVPKQHFGRAGGMIELGPAVSQVIAPALAGVLVVSLGLQAVILVDLATFVFAVVTLLIVRVPRPEATTAGQEGKGSLLHEAAYGWAYIQSRPGLLGLLIFAAATNLTMGFIMVLIIPLVLSFTSASTLGIILSIAGSGMLLGGLVMSIWGGPRRRMSGVLGFTLLGGALLLLGGLRPNVPLVACAAFVFLFGVPIISGCSQAIWLSKVAPDVQGRVFAVRRMIVLSSAPLTRLVVGPLSDNVFEPWLAPGGWLAASVGRIIGTGPGRGIALMLILLGIFNMLVTVIAYFSPRIRNVEDELPEAVGDKAFSTATIPSSRKERNMKRVRTWLTRIGIGLLAIIVILAGAGTWFVRRPWPQISGTIAVSGLSEPVQVIRDKWGVPQIYAQNEHDLFFAQGYVHAQDRLWQMEVNRSIANGTISSLLGNAGLRTDRLVRTLGLRRAAEQSWAIASSDSRAILEAYASGVNAYIETHRDRLPLEFTLLGISPEPWTPVDSLAYANVIALSLSHNYRLELLRAQVIAKLGPEAAQQLFAPYAEGTPIIVPPEAGGYTWMRDVRFDDLDSMYTFIGDPAVGWGSNNWVVSGSRTATGKPLLETDTHLGTDMPSIWYEIGLHGGRFDVVGFSFPSAPLVMIGHNQRIAWGETTLGQDVMDYYIEKLDDPVNPTQYEYMGKWYDLQVIHETIPVKGGQPVPLDIRLTRHGPIMTDVMSNWTGGSKQPLAVRWVMYEGNRLLEAVVRVNLAQNWNEFREATSFWDAPGLNMVYADVDGNIGYQSTGRTPIRVPEHQGIVPVPGWTGEYEWKGFIPFNEMPSTLNPPQGFIATANNRVVSEDYPYLLTYDWFPGFRAQRITEMLAANDHVTIDYIKQIEAQTYSYPAEYLRPYMLAIKPANDLEAQAQAELKVWDLNFETDRVGASVYEAWYVYLVQDTIANKLGDDLTSLYLKGQYERHGNQHVPMMIELIKDPNNAWFDDVRTPEKETRDDILRRSLTDAVNYLNKQYGKDPKGWQWGRMHTVSFPHTPFTGVSPLNWFFDSRPIPARGDHFSVDAASFMWNKPFQVIHCVSQRMIVDMGNFANSISIHTTGQSGHLFNPHREDFIPMWQNMQYHPMFFSQEAVKSNAEGVLTLAP